MQASSWRTLPCIYYDILNSARMIGEQQPFHIQFVDLFAQWPHSLHWHDAFEIGYVMQGSGTLVLNGQEFPFAAGHVYVINHAQQHMGYATDHLRLFVVHFHPSLLQDSCFHALGDAAIRPFTLGLGFTPILPAQDARAGQIRDHLQQIQAEYETAKPGWALMIKGQLLQIAGLLLRHFQSPYLLDADEARRQELLTRLTPALRLLEEQLTEPTAVADLAATVGLHPHYFTELFQKATGLSPVAYRNLRRIQLACQLLLAGNDSVAHIAERCGFGAVQPFNRLFRRLIGCTPGAYRDHIFTETGDPR